MVQKERRAATAHTVISDQGGRRSERPSPEGRAASGKAARAMAPLEAHAEFPRAGGRDPVALLLGQATTRVPELVPIRHGRMSVSPFTFYRGAALVMAADLQTTPTSGLRTQLCGDAHLSNFGAYASPERRLVFDINDFDETLPGPFEWDVKRLAASLVVAARDNGFTPKQCRTITLAGVESYRTAMRTFAGQTILDVWYAHLDIEDAVAEFRSTLTARRLKSDKADLKATDKALAKAHTRDSLQAIATGKRTRNVLSPGSSRVRGHKNADRWQARSSPRSRRRRWRRRSRTGAHQLLRAVNGRSTAGPGRDACASAHPKLVMHHDSRQVCATTASPPTGAALNPAPLTASRVNGAASDQVTVRQPKQNPNPVANGPGPVPGFHTITLRAPVGAAALTVTKTSSSDSETTSTEFTRSP
jgi:hypothetical protein